jgi:tetratricopeptide (TPR) repeat protein
LASARLDPARTYLAARAAAISGDHSRSAELLANLVDSSAAGRTIAREAVSQAISAGETKLAVRLARAMQAADLSAEARLLLVADELRSRRIDRALQYLQSGAGGEVNLAFIAPILEVWRAAERRDGRALELLDRFPTDNPLLNYLPEQRAFVLLKLGRAAEAHPHAQRAIANAGPREHRLRLGLADAFLAAGDRARALEMVHALGTETGRARQRVLEGRQSGLAVTTAADAFAEALLALAIDLNRLNNRSLPVALSQVARYASPGNSSAAVLLGVFLEGRGRIEEAIGAYRSVTEDNGLAAQARDAEVRALVDSKRGAEALSVAQRALARSANVSDYARLGDAYAALKRYNEAADAYGRAYALVHDGTADQRWPLLLLQASALEDADRWPEARQALGAALALAPNEPLILNFLGYAKLERGEDLDSAEAMIRKASELDPDNASITDSLGWALYKRGRLDEAIQILTRAAKGDPVQAEIHEHLGDALYRAGNRFEARYAWQAALATADDEIARRVKAKIEAGLTPATAAP